METGGGGGLSVSAPVLPEGAAFRFNFPLANDGELVASGSAAPPTARTTKVLLNDIGDAPWNACDEDDDVGVIVSTHAIAPARAAGAEDEDVSIAAPVGSTIAARATLLGSFLEDLLVCAPETSVDGLPSMAPAPAPAQPNGATDALDGTAARDKRAGGRCSARIRTTAACSARRWAQRSTKRAATRAATAVLRRAAPSTS